uniref:Armadillo repeat-containing protein 8 n=1 Tax=Alexandrium catenella TaxID=2925 RepID=A0A7S1MLX9_ALECA|mmetsp:Transcript_29611/g.79994  ORF Transcript_29611/g.79994 Transcript_29611/m.79994 type:complete len:362 (+) Transcript_29611:33-1118(+)
MAAMSTTAVVPVSPRSAGGEDASLSLVDKSLETRVNLTRPPDSDNELIKVAALHGAPGMLAVMRARKDYGWFVVLCLRAIEVCIGPRTGKLPVLEACDPVAFSMQMLEMEMIDEIFQVMKDYEHVKDVQRAGLAIVQTLITNDTDWRDEVARKGGVGLLCEIAKQRRNSPNVLCQVMTCISYLAAEDYIEVMLCQHNALEHVVYVLGQYPKNKELAMCAALALLNLTVCEPHIEELMDKDSITPVLEVYDAHPSNVDLIVVLCGIFANFSVKHEVQHVLVREGLFPRLRDAMLLDPGNVVLQVACLKALVNYSTSADFYMKMEQEGIPTLVGQVMVDHPHDPGVQRYGNYYLGQHTSCPIL